MAIEHPKPADGQTRARMQMQRERDTRMELALRSALHRRGFRFRVHRRIMTGSRREADVVFPGARVAVFVDGCFWHGCPKHASWPKHNAAFWRAKIEANIARDRDTDTRLSEAGWTVVRVWEHEAVDVAIDRIAGVLSGGPGVAA